MRSRRVLLQGGAALAVTAALPSGTAEASGPGTLPAFFRAKSEPDIDRTMRFFARPGTIYGDATLGWLMPSWQALHDTFAQYMPTWPDAASSRPTRIIGDENSAVVFFTNSPGMFGPSEIRAVGAVDIRHGKFVRWIDYWDGRHYGLDGYRALRVPDDQFPRDFGESGAGTMASTAARRAVANLAGALRAGDHSAVTACFTEDAVFEDLPAHIQIAGTKSIARFLAAAGTRLPFAGPDVRVRHVLSGGYEWTSRAINGITALEVDDRGRITRLTSMWDGARVSRETLISLAGAAVEE